MKKSFFGFVAVLLCMDSMAVERSMSLFANSNFLGSYSDIYDEYHLREKSEVYSSGKYIFQDYLLPVGSSNTSSVEVMNGYCGILASQAHFAGTWKVLNPGEHTSMGSFDNLTQSIATYKMIGQQQTTCNPKNDIPTLYSGTSQTGSVYPLVINNGYNAQGGVGARGYSSITLHSNHRSARKSVNGTLIASGGFSDKAVSLKVPACYQVRLNGLNTKLQVVSRTFMPGSYNLSGYGLAKNLTTAQVTRQANCTQSKPTITPPPTPTTPGACKTGTVYGDVSSTRMTELVPTINTFCQSCGFTAKPITSGPYPTLRVVCN